MFVDKKEENNMKEIKVEKERKIIVPKGHFNSSWFKCQSCGYEIQMLVLGNHATCPECGRMMVRK